MFKSGGHDRKLVNSPENTVDHHPLHASFSIAFVARAANQWRRHYSGNLLTFLYSLDLYLNWHLKHSKHEMVEGIDTE